MKYAQSSSDFLTEKEKCSFKRRLHWQKRQIDHRTILEFHLEAVVTLFPTLINSYSRAVRSS